MNEPPNAGDAAAGAVSHLQALLRFDTRNPPGNELPAIRYLEEQLAREGVAAQVFEPVPGRANLVARLRGDGSAPPLLLTSHVDVVAVERERWTRDPFGGEIADGCLWGRGAVDMKGLTAFELETFLALKRSGAKLRRDVILLAVCDEEAGTEHGSRWMVDNEPDTIRAEYALNEFGGFTVHLGQHRVYPIGAAEKGVLWMELLASGEPGHGSMPHNANAVLKLAEAIRRATASPLEHRVRPAARGFVDEASRALGGISGVVLRGLLHEKTAPLALKLLHKKDPERARVFHAMLHQTVTPTMLRAGEKENVIPSQARAVLDGRFLPGTAPEDLLRAVQARVGPAIEVRELARGAASEVPIDTPLYRLLCEKLREHDPGARPCPWLTVGYTDAVNLSKLGIRCYGFYPLKLPRGFQFASMVHGHDERVPLDGYRWGYQVFEDVVRTFVC